MLNLNNVTLLSISCDKIEQTKRAIDISTRNIEFKQVKFLTNEDIKMNGVDIIKIDKLDKDGYNTFMVKELYKYIETDFVQIIQWDGFVLNEKSWRDEYFNFDYIGAPWWLNDEFNVGNGGFSLRSKKFLDFIHQLSPLETKNYKELDGNKASGFTPEDAVLCRYYGKFLKDVGFKFAPESLASIFSIEGNPKFGYNWKDQFGFHGPSVQNMPISFQG